MVEESDGFSQILARSRISSLARKHRSNYMKTKMKKTLYWMSVLFVAGILASAFPQRASADQDDPPGRVARLNYLRGSVSFEPAGEADWVQALVNRPITTGDMLWADDGARAEMHLGSATIRLDSRTGMSFLNLDDHTTQIQFSEGTINIRVVRLDPDEDFEVDTPNQAFSILRAGQYRVEASEDGNSTLVTVRAGMGEVTGGGRTYSVEPGLSGNFTGTDLLYADIYRAERPDEFDNWSQDRDRREDASRSARYVSRDVVGYEDLDDNGSWRSDPDYGDVWVPRVARGWAPYRDGHWAWISPWGWTWVDDEPWGYAPFHYGRWVYARNDWCWVPGPRTVRPVYAPALVVFVGGPSFGVSISFGGGRGGGNVGWFPLGPREVYVPGYNASREYVTRVNVSNTTVNNTTVVNIYNNQVNNNNRGNNRNNSEIRYANRTAPGGVTVVSQNTFAGAQPVSRAVVAVNQREIASAPVSQRAELAPTRNSVFGTSAPSGNRAPRPPAEVSNRSVVAKRPPPPPPVPFERQQQKLAAQPGQPLGRTEVEGLRPANAPPVQQHVRQAPPGRPATADSNQPGARPTGQPSNAPPASIGANGPAGRNDRPNGGFRGQPGNAQPPSQPPASVGGNPPVNNVPPGRNDRPSGGYRGQPENAPQPSQQPATVGGNPPANVAPPARNDRPNGPNRGQPENTPQPSQPPANVGGNPPANNVPSGRNDRPNGGNRGQPGNAQPPSQPPANVGGNPPVNNAPPGRNDRPNGPNRGQPENAPAPSQPPANVGGNPPANNAPPGRNDRPNGGYRGQPGNAQPPSQPPANVGGNPPANAAPPARNERPNGPGPGQPPNRPPAASEPPKPADRQANPPPPKEQPPQQGNNKKADDKKKNPDDQAPQR